MKKSQKIKLSILIPVRNEGKNIERMLKILNSRIRLPMQVLIIYDFPNDDTIPVVKKLARKYKNTKLVQNKFGKGVANAIRMGIKASKGDYILILAADDLGPVYGISDMIILMDKGCDFVSCTRYAYGGRRDNDSFTQKIFSGIGNQIFRSLSGSVFTDLTTGFKMFRKSILKKIKLESDSVSWAIVFEMAIKAQAAGMRLGEVPIRSSDREHGKSTFRLGPWFKEYIRWFFWGVNHLHGKRIKKPMRIQENIA
jgi:glycosyltransferase involved in cell wall biosynthesis